MDLGGPAGRDAAFGRQKPEAGAATDDAKRLLRVATESIACRSTSLLLWAKRGPEVLQNMFNLQHAYASSIHTLSLWYCKTWPSKEKIDAIPYGSTEWIWRRFITQQRMKTRESVCGFILFMTSVESGDWFTKEEEWTVSSSNSYNVIRHWFITNFSS